MKHNLTETHLKKLNSDRVGTNLMNAILSYRDGINLDLKVPCVRTGVVNADVDSTIVNIGGKPTLFAHEDMDVRKMVTIGESHVLFTQVGEATARVVSVNGTRVLFAEVDNVIDMEFFLIEGEDSIDMIIPIETCFKMGNLVVGIATPENGLSIEEAVEVLESVAYSLSFITEETVIEPL